MATDEPEDDWARASVEHLQAAAREVIQATRTLLDAAEELVDDPKALQGMVGNVTSLAQSVLHHLRDQAAGGHGGSGGSGDDGDDGDDGGGRVERIQVS